MANNNDILVELSTVDIVKLSQFYCQHQDVAPHISSYLQTALAWKERTRGHDGQDLVQVFVPEVTDWLKNGTFISVGHFPWKMLITFTMEETGDELCDVLVKTKRFDYDKHIYLFYALHEKHIPTVDRAMTIRGLKRISDDKTDLWRLNQPDAILSQASVPKEYTIAPLKVANSFIINDNWPHKSDNSEPYVRTLIEMNGGYGIYTKEDGELSAWVLKSQLGQLAMLQVLEGHARKGLAQALISTLSKEIGDEGFPALATIVQTNTASQNLFKKCGFTKQFMCAFYAYK